MLLQPSQYVLKSDFVQKINTPLESARISNGISLNDAQIEPLD